MKTIYPTKTPSGGLLYKFSVPTHVYLFNLFYDKGLTPPPYLVVRENGVSALNAPLEHLMSGEYLFKVETVQFNTAFLLGTKYRIRDGVVEAHYTGGDEWRPTRCGHGTSVKDFISYLLEENSWDALTTFLTLVKNPTI